MERAVTVRPALPEDGQVLFAMNRAFNGEGVASPQEAALALAHPGPEQVLLAFVAGEPAGFLCGLLKRSACYSRPSAEVTELYVCPGCRRQGVARQLLEEKERSDLTGADIRERQLQGTVRDGQYVLTARYACVEDIGFEEAILTESK